MPSIEELVAIKDRVQAQYLSRPGVTGIDVGYKVVGGVQTDEIAIRVHVRQKKASVSKAQLVPSEIDGVVTDVLQREYELQVVREQLDVSAQADTNHYATLEGGISMGPSRAIGGYIYAGTLGAIVIDKASGSRAALTNFHVACVDSTWHIGDRQVQPSRIDTGVVPGDEFGAIARATLSSAVDGAVISIDSGRATAGSIVDIGDVAGSKAATLGLAVRKRGRTTALTYGSVDGLSLSVNVDYGDGLGTHTLTDQVSITADTGKNAVFSDHGDSGSVIVDSAGHVVALLFAGSGASTVGNPIANVLSELNIELVTGKSLVKDLKDSRKDVVKEKEVRKELVKEKEVRKEFVKEKEIRKELVSDNKQLKDLRDVKPVENFPPVGPGPVESPTVRGLAQRLAALEAVLGSLESFVSAELRPDLAQSAFSGESDLTPEQLAVLRAEAEKQAADAAAAKAELDTPWA